MNTILIQLPWAVVREKLLKFKVLSYTDVKFNWSESFMKCCGKPETDERSRLLYTGNLNSQCFYRVPAMKHFFKYEPVRIISHPEIVIPSPEMVRILLWFRAKWALAGTERGFSFILKGKYRIDLADYSRNNRPVTQFSRPIPQQFRHITQSFRPFTPPDSFRTL